MKNYIIYKESTGEIVQTGQCPDNLVEKQAAKRPGFKSIEGTANDMTHFISDGVVKKHTDAKIKQKKKELEDSMVGGLSKVEKILKYLKANGTDLGPDGNYL